MDLPASDPAEYYRCLAVDTFKDADLRHKLATDPSTWPSILYQLRLHENHSDSSITMFRLLQLCSNLSAIPFAGSADILYDLCAELLRLEASNLQKLKWQILSHLAIELANTKKDQVSDLISQFGAINFKDVLNQPSTAVPLLVFTSRLVSIADSAFTDYLSRSDMYALLLESYPDWIVGGAEYDKLIYVATDFTALLIKKGLLGCAITSTEQILTHKVTLFKLLDSLLTSPNLSSGIMNHSFWASTNGQSFRGLLTTEYQHAVTDIIPFITKSDRQSERGLHLWNLSCSLLQIMEAILPLQSSEGLEAFRSGLLHHSIVLLKAAKHLPQASKLKEISSEYEPDMTEFPYLKSLLIPVITYLIRDSQPAQNEMRTSGGLFMVLECCVIDANNPFLKERAIMCIKYLLEKNQENQKIVADMEAKRTVGSNVLHEAGYEAEVVNGQVRLKPTKTP